MYGIFSNKLLAMTYWFICIISNETVSGVSIIRRLGGGLDGVVELPSAGTGSGYVSVGPFPPTKC